MTKHIFNDEHIRVAAYYIWQKAGCPEGREQEFWNLACQELYGVEKKPVAKKVVKSSCKKISSKSSSLKSASLSVSMEPMIVKKELVKKTLVKPVLADKLPDKKVSAKSYYGVKK